MVIAIAQMDYEHVDDVVEVQKLSYREDLHEEGDIYVEKLKFYPKGSVVALHENRVVGYIVTFPWDDTVPQLNSTGLSMPEKITRYWLNDMAIAPTHRGQGVSKLILSKVAQIAREESVDVVSLVCISPESEKFWQKIGFSSTFHEPLAEETLAKYGDFVRHMGMLASTFCERFQ